MSAMALPALGKMVGHSGDRAPRMERHRMCLGREFDA